MAAIGSVRYVTPAQRDILHTRWTNWKNAGMPGCVEGFREKLHALEGMAPSITPVLSGVSKMDPSLNCIVVALEPDSGLQMHMFAALLQERLRDLNIRPWVGIEMSDIGLYKAELGPVDVEERRPCAVAFRWKFWRIEDCPSCRDDFNAAFMQVASIVSVADSNHLSAVRQLNQVML